MSRVGSDANGRALVVPIVLAATGTPLGTPAVG